jgi:transcriptional regulator with XRE-family HTH domain
MHVTNTEQLQALARDRRISLKQTQEAVATVAGVSRKWLSEFERGKESVDLSLVLRLLGALGLVVQVTSPAGAETAEQAEVPVPSGTRIHR